MAANKREAAVRKRLGEFVLANTLSSVAHYN
jgi:hypothetical protein